MTAGGKFVRQFIQLSLHFPSTLIWLLALAAKGSKHTVARFRRSSSAISMVFLGWCEIVVVVGDVRSLCVPRSTLSSHVLHNGLRRGPMKENIRLLDRIEEGAVPVYI